MNSRSVPWVIAGVALAACGVVVGFGPLNPPAGSVASSYKTLTEVEPRVAVSGATTPGDADSLYKITQPGSYYLTGNVTGVAGKHGIEITSGGVTLDLNGFDLVGLGPASGAFDGVSVTVNSLANITIKNGSVRSWGDGGVDLGFLAIGARITNVTASNNGGIGINGAIACVIADCAASSNGAVTPPPLGGHAGIRASNGSTVSNSAAYSNSGSGFQVNNGCTINACSAYFNAAGAGTAVNAAGITVGSACTVTGCTAFTNSAHGIYLGEASTARDCSAQSNTRSGLFFSAGGSALACNASYNTSQGIQLGDSASAVDCNVSHNQGRGILGSRGCKVSNCTASSNAVHGIDLGDQGSAAGCITRDNASCGVFASSGSSVLECTSTSNTLDGIRCSHDCVVRGNNCYDNDAGGIRATGNRARLDSNTCTNNLIGYDIDGIANLLVRNNASNNTTNWSTAQGTILLVMGGPHSPPLNGNEGGFGYRTEDPNANFTHLSQ